MFTAKKKTVVYQWELDIARKWSIEELKNRIWMNKECGQSIPGCVSREALRIELTLRGEQPNGYHEDVSEIDMDNIVIEQSYPVRKKRGR